ncbi:glycosyltransferase family 39 protein [Anaeromyxobacter soli]|uniref:glycosyltransferase family 39 protein n=1 Tax=Anaeromyxobacter soli TaxID=2922725 RepID=UPI001FAF3502|nr:glycosyltransferase family 39 protein [Anaeromyxobacter sp. SG29]
MHAPDRRPALAALLLGAAATLFHVYYAGHLALSPQEAYYWEWARRLDLSYFDHPPLAAWTIALTTGLLGDSERAIRLAAALHSAIFCAFFWLSVRRLFGARVALVALAAGLAVPLFALGQVIITPDGPLLSGWAMALYFTLRALDEERPAWLLAAGAATGWALLGKYTGALLLPQILLALLLDPRGRRMLRTPWPWAGAALAGALFAPVIVWNLRHGLASFEFQTQARVAHSSLRPVLVARYVGLQAALVTPVLLVLAVEAIVQAIRRRADPAFRMCAIFAAPLLCLATLVSPFHWVKGNWLAPVYPTAFAAAAALALAGGWRRRAGLAGIALALAGSVYTHLVPVFPAVPFPARDEGSAGWRDLAARVDAERARLGADTFVAGCNYKVSAELAYYLPGHPRTWSAEIAGDHGLQYRYWFDPAALAGREGLLVLDPREKHTCERRAEACRPLVALPPLEVKRGDATVTTFELWRCRYGEPPPAPPGLAAAPAPR